MTKQTWLQEQVTANPTLKLEELLSKLNTPSLVNNPTPRAKVPKPITVDEIASTLPALDRFNIAETRTYGLAVQAANENKRDVVARHLATLLAGGKLKQAQFDQIAAELNTQIDDPDYKAQVSRTPAELAGFDRVQSFELKKVMS